MGRGTTKGSTLGLLTAAEAAMRPAGRESVPSGRARPTPPMNPSFKNFLRVIFIRLSSYSLWLINRPVLRSLNRGAGGSGIRQREDQGGGDSRTWIGFPASPRGGLLV